MRSACRRPPELPSPELGSIFDFVGGSEPGGKGSPGLVAEKRRGGQRALHRALAEFGVEQRVVKAGAGGIGGAGAVVDGVEASPIAGGQTHGAGLAAGVELAAGQGEGVERAARCANGVDFAVGGWIVACGDGVDALADDLAVAHNNRGKRAAGTALNVLDGESDGAA